MEAKKHMDGQFKRDWVDREVDIAIRKAHEGFKSEENEAYARVTCACINTAYKMYNMLDDSKLDNVHQTITLNILNRLFNMDVLTEINDTEDVWTGGNIDGDGGKLYSSLRYDTLLKYVNKDRKVSYSDMNRVISIYERGEYKEVDTYKSIALAIIDELYPLQLPYMPKSMTYVVYFTSNSDEPGILKAYQIVNPEGKVSKINRRYKEGKNGWEEIGSGNKVVS